MYIHSSIPGPAARDRWLHVRPFARTQMLSHILPNSSARQLAAQDMPKSFSHDHHTVTSQHIKPSLDLFPISRSASE